jgi:hypothetical protein
MNPLCVLVAQGDAPALERELLGSTPSAQELTEALFAAILAGHDDMVRVLLANEANPNGRVANNPMSPLMTAIGGGHRGISRQLVVYGARLDDELAGVSLKQFANEAGHGLLYADLEDIARGLQSRRRQF